MYSVEVSNKLGEANGEAKVEVEPKEKKPIFISELHDTEVVEGFPVKFEIKVMVYIHENIIPTWVGT